MGSFVRFNDLTKFYKNTWFGVNENRQTYERCGRLISYFKNNPPSSPFIKRGKNLNSPFVKGRLRGIMKEEITKAYFIAKKIEGHATLVRQEF